MDRPDQKQAKWYLRPTAVIVALLAIGPFALPLAWISPSLRTWQKILITIAVVILSIWLVRASSDIYSKFSVQMQELQGVLK
ncbi:MAG: hypothetical protein WC592_03700 [Candidatus Omnitrophota bacterium]|nr:hypothetical protein [Candidatus Omnitrophota bacterium]